MTALSACSNERAKTEMRTWVLSSVTFWHLRPHLWLVSWFQHLSPHLCDLCVDFDTWVLISVTRVMISTLESSSLWLVSWFWHLSHYLCDSCHDFDTWVSWFWHSSPHVWDSCHDFDTWVSWFWHLSPHLCDSCHDSDTWALLVNCQCWLGTWLETCIWWLKTCFRLDTSDLQLTY